MYAVSDSRPDSAELRTALEAADLRVLVMCLVHMTGERRWMEAPYKPKRDVRLIADPEAGFAPDIAEEIRSKIGALLAEGARPPLLDDPGAEMLGEMMSVCLGEAVAPEYVAMMREDLGFDSGDHHWSGCATGPSSPAEKLTAFAHGVDTPVLVVGAGISGLGLAVQLTRLGFEHLIVEKNSNVGGTWFENRYPGCGVDTPNHFYSFSYEPNHGWRYYFSPRDELQAYVEHFADKYGIRPRIRFDTELVAAEWDEASNRWTATLRHAGLSTQVTCRVLISAIGHFNRPADITIQGSESFAGPLFHSARWPDGLDLTGRRVAIVGTGASSMQIVPTIVDDVASLTVYQRTPQWVRQLPEYTEPVKPGTQWLLEHVPHYATWNRFTLFWRYGDGLLRFLKKDPEWPHAERSLNRTNDRHRQEMTDAIVRALDGRSDLVDKCVPTYPPFGKRMILDKGWFASLLRPHVELVTDAIEAVDPEGIATVDGRHRDHDVVVMATGFSVADLAARLGITGRNGRTLSEAWQGDNPTALYGLTVPEFPNFFCMYGPNTNAGHGGSAFLLSEAQTRYITSGLVAMVENDLAAMEVRSEVLEEFIHGIDEEHATLVWTHPGMSTYYRNQYGRVISTMPFRLVDYWAMTHDVDLSQYVLTSAR